MEIKLPFNKNLLLPACLKVLFFTNKYLNSFKSEIPLNSIKNAVPATLETNYPFITNTKQLMPL